jgi:chromosome segregation protein
VHIDEIVLDDFKSFGRTTRIPLYEDFTTISGPNGAGKSNIVEGILFGLGLAASRSIRAERLPDLIYDPEDEAAEGPREASVEVILDNSDGTVDRADVVSAVGSDEVGDVEELSIRRRVKETEDNYYSYYYINGRSVNQSDVRDLLAAAGVSPEGYNVVMQGDVTTITTGMTPTERRAIIDEIAGVAEFDAKKADAMDELDTVEERIDEADLRIEEKEERLDRLADERETALEFRDLREEKSELEDYVRAAELEDKREKLDRLEDEIKDARDALAERRSALDERQGAVMRLEEDLAELEAEIDRRGEEERLELKREIEEIKADIGALEGRIEGAEADIEDAEADRREAFVAIDRTEETIDELEDEIRETKVEKASVADEIADHEATLEELEAELDATDTAFDELKAELATWRAALEDAKTARNDAQREQDRLIDEARRRSGRIEEIEAEIDAAADTIDACDDRIADLERELESAEGNVDRIEDAIADLEDRRSTLREDIASIEDDLQDERQTYADLESRDTDDDSYGKSVSAVLGADIDGVHGAVGQLGAVDGEYAVACETAAGGRLNSVVVDDDGVGQRCIEFLKSRNNLRATFLPLTEFDDRGRPSLPARDGVIDYAYNLVDFDDAYRGIFSYVLGTTLVVEDMDTARSLMGDFRMVTLDGDLVETSGAMTGGSGSGARYSFGEGGGQLDRVGQRIVDLEQDLEAKRDELQSVEADLDDARDRRREATDRVDDVESDLAAAREERDAADERIDDLEDELAELEDETADVDDRTTELERTIERHDAAIAHVEARIDEMEAELADSDVPELTERIDETEAKIDDCEDRLADLDADLNELQLERSHAEERIEELNDDVEAAQNRKADAEERIADLEEQIAEREDDLEETQAAVEELEDELADLKADRDELREELEAAKAERDDAKVEMRTVRERLHGLERDRTELADEIADVEAEVADYDPEEIPDLDDLEADIAELEEEMEALRPVNETAIEEYDEVESVLDDLQDRRSTLETERDEIVERIESYEEAKRETFMDAYEGIGAHFEEIFERLADGTAELHLENEEDPFDGGLTMMAKPADKPVKRLEQISGGEKTLTGLAFVFAIQRYDPAPFYALDEVDASLDVQNVERVGELLHEIASDAQFIVVTHRTAMLERSERAIGVTMEGNVSQVHGVELGALTEGGADAVPADD